MLISCLVPVHIKLLLVHTTIPVSHICKSLLAGAAATQGSTPAAPPAGATAAAPTAPAPGTTPVSVASAATSDVPPAKADKDVAPPKWPVRPSGKDLPPPSSAATTVTVAPTAAQGTTASAAKAPAGAGQDSTTALSPQLLKAYYYKRLFIDYAPPGLDPGIISIRDVCRVYLQGLA